MYVGVEWTNPPENVRAALNTHPRFKAFNSVPGPDLAVSVRIITRAGGAAYRHGGVLSMRRDGISKALRFAKSRMWCARPRE